MIIRRVSNCYHYSKELAGAPGLEPGITGSKPVALPLGYAPIRLVISNPQRAICTGHWM